MAWIAYRWWPTLWQAGTIDGKLKAFKLTFSSIVQVGHWMLWLRYQKADALKQPQATLPFANHTSTQKTLHKFIGVLTQLHIVNQHAVRCFKVRKYKNLIAWSKVRLCRSTCVYVFMAVIMYSKLHQFLSFLMFLGMSHCAKDCGRKPVYAKFAQRPRWKRRRERGLRKKRHTGRCLA